MEILNRIKYDGRPDEAQWLIYKCPSDQFVLGSQLIVNQGQEALFFNGGEAQDLFGPGTHTLSTGNLPLLGKIVNLAFGGKTPFSAEVYFINKTSNLDMRWGTDAPIPLEDPKYGLLLNIGAYGQYGITIKDSRLFVSKLVGAVPGGAVTNPKLVLRYFNGLINAKIKSVTAEYMIEKHISFLEISLYLSQLSDVFKKCLDDEFERFGIELTNFYCVSIAPKPEDYAKLRSYKEELALGQDFYQQRRTFDILERMASNPSSGGIANAGIGLGMGLGVSRQVGNLFTDVGQIMNPGKSDNASRTRSEDAIKCPKCGSMNEADMKFCGNCGSELRVNAVCPYCGATISAGLKFCGKCGKSLEDIKCMQCGFINKPGMKFCGNCGHEL